MPNKYRYPLVISNILESFILDDNFLQKEYETAGELIDAISEKLSIPSDQMINIKKLDPDEEDLINSFNKIKEEVEKLGGEFPDHLDDKFDVNRIFPIKDRIEKWNQLTKSLECEMPALEYKENYFLLSCSVMIVCIIPLFVILAQWFDQIEMPKNIYIECLFIPVFGLGPILIPIALTCLIMKKRHFSFQNLTVLIKVIWDHEQNKKTIQQ